tara:strand:+ start:761 stop:1588 length:828 start_codon:yes stop_codon:yes gene_type:complete
VKLLATLVLTLFISSIFATSSYYPTEYKTLFNGKNLHDSELKEKIFILLSSKHMYKSGKDDTIAPHCTGEGRCYEHKSIGYKGARKVLFGKIHLREDGDGYFIKDVYCRKKITRSESRLGPNIIPKNSVLNCEHTWPQSRFNFSFPKGLQKSDLHHLYPTDSRANSIRGNNEFADVDGDELTDCDGAYYGVQKWQGGNFEPPREHKGNVARALFYFSVRYKIKISSQEEDYLRTWHELDPVDEDEMNRNDIIHTVQGNRNPFIDYPNLVDQIADF